MDLLVRIDSAKDVGRATVGIEVIFTVLLGKPDYVEVVIGPYQPVIINMREGVSQYSARLNGLIYMPFYIISIWPRIIYKSGPHAGEYIPIYDDGDYSDNHHVETTIPVRSRDSSTDYPPPAISRIRTYPKKAFKKSGAIFDWISAKKYDNYELCLRVPGNAAYEIVDLHISAESGSYNLVAGRFQSFDFAMSLPGNDSKYAVQIRGTINSPRHYSNWSEPIVFIAARPLFNMRAFFEGYDLHTGIRKYFPGIRNLNLRKTMLWDELP